MADNNTWLSPEERAALARQRELESARRAAVQNRTQTAPRAQQPQATARPAGTNPTQTNPRAQQRPQPGAAQSRPAQPAGRPAVRGGMPSGVRQVQRSAHPTAPVRPGEATGDTKELPRYIHTAKRGGHKPPRRKTRTAPPVRIKLPPKVRAVLLAIAAVTLIFIILMICGVRYTKDTRADGSTIKFFGIANASGIQNGWISADGTRGRIADGNKITYSNGDVYEGTFKNDMRNGQGTYTFANGERYVGSFRDNQLSGEGTYTWPSGKTYTGRFENGKIVEE